MDSIVGNVRSALLGNPAIYDKLKTSKLVDEHSVLDCCSPLQLYDSQPAVDPCF
ncbi:MAG: hypothetical protein U0936_02085 [Planctomycetaceae bacterium]